MSKSKTERKDVSRFEILMDAGYGAQKAGDILIRSFAALNKNVYIEPMFPAEISPPFRTRPALSGAIIRVAEFDLFNIGNNTDIIIASHEINIDRRLDDDEHNPRCQVLLDMDDIKKAPDSYQQVLTRLKDLGLTVHQFELKPEANKILQELSGKGKNMYYIGILAAIYNAPEEVVVKEIAITFGKKLKEEILNKNISMFHHGYVHGKEFPLSYEIDSRLESAKSRLLIDGNTAMSLGLIHAGIKLYAGYPITPASSIMHTLARELPNHGGMVHQAEDEISAIGTAIGAYFGGVPSATGTSGPGLSLKQEFISYASCAEAPVIIIDVQRAGPSTGLPTRTEQSDLLPAIFGAHGDYTKIIISVGTVTDCYYAPFLARYLTEKLKMPVFIMSDFQIANCYKVIKTPEVAFMEKADDIDDRVLEHFRLQRLPEDLEMIRLDQSLPGTPGHRRIITGLNTDESGSVNYFSKANMRSHQIRNEKVHALQRALREPKLLGSVNEGDVLVVGWGSTRGAIEEAVERCQKQGLAVSGLCFRIVYPLIPMLRDVFKRFKQVVTVELSYGDSLKSPALARLMRAETRVDVQSIICQATGRPIRPAAVEAKIKELLNGNRD